VTTVSEDHLPHQRSVPVRYVDLRDGGANNPQAQPVSVDPWPAWVRLYVPVLVVLDAVAVLAGGAIAMLVRFGTLAEPLKGHSYLVFVVGATVPWVGTMAACRAYEPRFLGLGSEEFRRVANGAVRFTALAAVIAFTLDLDPARGMVAVALPASGALGLAQRYAARQLLHRLRASGTACQRVLLVGEGPAVEAMAQHLAGSPHAGLRVVGRCGPGSGGSLAHVRATIERCGADTVAVAHSPGVSPEALRQMAWTLEGAGVELLVAPAFTDVAGPRIHVRPVSGLPLLQIAAPRFTGGRWLLKRSIDLAVTVLLLVALAPLLVAVAVLVRLTSRGPVLFRQERIGRGGKPFRLYKFRSMCVDAEQLREELLEENEADGVLFKLRHDPRVTRIGRGLRRYSLDELPQLVNVLRGQMSLVGPRPPLPSEVEQYEQHVHRRLLVTPGITGLWQVSGRSELSWTESVRLDLYYVENWSVAFDAEIAWKTVFAVLRGSGAH
jgi:exopolysaccharide biosynthesis polyprenyl glycosylphosphotransferase